MHNYGERGHFPNWEQEYEHLRDRGRTWGPGVDDVEPLTEEEMARQDALMADYRKTLQEYSVPPHEEFAAAGKALKEFWPGPGGPREEFSKKRIEFCALACKSLGYSLELGWAGKHMGQNKEAPSFSVSVEYFGWLPDRGGNIHKYFVCGIENVEDCLQLVADFQALGATPTTWYGEHFHYSTGHSGELRYELIRRFGIGRPGDSPAPRKEEHQIRIDVGEIAALGARGGAKIKEQAQASYRNLDSVIESAESRSNVSRVVGSVKDLDRDKDL